MPDTSSHAAQNVSPVVAACAGLLVLAVAMGIGRFAFTPILPMMLDDAGLTLRGGSLLASANYVGYLIGAVCAIFVRIRPTVALRAGLAVIGLSTLAMGFDLGLTGWAAMRAVAGVASAWMLISVSAWSMDALAKAQRPILNSMVFAGVGAGIAGAGLLCILLSARGAHSSHAWIALGAVSCLIAAAIWRVFRGQAETGAVQAGIGGGAAVTSRWNGESIRLVACYGVSGFGYIIPATFLPVMAKQALQDPSLFGWSWPVFGAAASVSALAVGVLVRRLGSRRLWLISQVVMAVGVALPAIRPHFGAILLSALMVGGTFMVMTSCAMQEARRIAPERATQLMAAMTAAFGAGQIVGPLAASWLGGADGGFAPGLLTAAVLLGLSAFALGEKRADAPAMAGK